MTIDTQFWVILCSMILGCLLFGIIYSRAILKKETVETDIYITGMAYSAGEAYLFKFEYMFRDTLRIGQCESTSKFEIGKKYRVKMNLWREFSDPQIVQIIEAIDE